MDKTKLTIEEKISLLNGKTSWLTKDIQKEDIHIPSVLMTDGPHGIRKEVSEEDKAKYNGSYPSTLFPNACAVACSFDKNVAYMMGKAIAKEAKHYNVQMFLGPGVNIKRDPRCGRNFEYYSEDPYLAGALASSYIKGAQSEHIGTCVKHFAVNNQETYRLTIDSIIDDRALREIYLKAFKMCVDENVASIMASYNKINGVYGCQNRYLLKTILREEWGYKNFVVSDWGAVNDITKSIKNGLSLEMPNSSNINSDILLQAYKNEEISEEEIDIAVDDVLNFVNEYKDNKQQDFNIDLNHDVAIDIAKQSIVLLKNDSVLPINKDEEIVVIGKFAKEPRVQGGGSSYINMNKVENVLDNISMYSNNYQYYDGYKLEKDCYDEELIKEAVSKSKNKKVVLFVGLTDIIESEGYDRKNLDLPYGQLKLIEEITKVTNKVIVVLSVGSVVLMPFINNVQGILNCYLLGEASGKPILDILFGKCSPSGRLSETYVKNLEDCITANNFADGNNAVWYQESIFVGYRYYTTFNKDVLFPFGYGLSYSQFAYTDLYVSDNEINDTDITVTCKVKNIGAIKAKEVVLLFIGTNESSVYKPIRELKRFDKVELDIGEERTITFVLNNSDFAYYDVNMEKYNVDKGTYKIEICKDANTVILSKDIIKKENVVGFKEHTKTCYNEKELKLNEKDFEAILGYRLPPKSIVKTKPYTLNSIPEDFKGSFFGRIVYKMIVRQAKKIAGKNADPVIVKTYVSSAVCVPIRSLAAMSGGSVNINMAYGMVDIANGKVIKGLRKILKKDK